jgi:hypothetical protein
VTDDIVEAYSGASSINVGIHRTTAPSNHPSTVVIAEKTLARIGVRSGETVRLRTDDREDAYAVVETGDAIGLDIGHDELLADVPVFAELSCGPRDRVDVTRTTLPEANHFTVVPVDPATTNILERCSVTGADLVDAVAHQDGIVEFRPAGSNKNDIGGPYYAEVTEVCPDAPARVTADTRVDIHDLDDDERPRGVLSPAERRELYTTNLTEQSADDELRTRLRERLENSLHDLRALAERLPDEDLRRVFGDDDLSRTTGAATDVVALCWLGLDIAEEKPNWRIEQAIKRALYAGDEDGEVDLRVTRQELPPAATVLDRFRRYGPDALDTHLTHEQLWASPEVDPYELYEVTCEQLGEDLALPPAGLVLERLAYRSQARRFPTTQVLDVSTEVEDG